jgi:DUF1680 family protein
LVVPGSGGLGGSLEKTHSSFETPCGAYAHFKITRYLLRVTGDSRYGDSMERVLYNTIGGAWPILPDGTTFYYSDYNNAARKVHHRDKWPCCSGTFPQLAADYGISSYYQSRDGIYVNLFLPSRLSWSQDGTPCTLTQTTAYPKANTSHFAFQLARPETFAAYIRIPEWAGPKTTISVNGRRIDGQLAPGTFSAVRRTWKDGDRLDLELHMPLRLESVDNQNPNTVALMHGPAALFGVSALPSNLTRAQLLAAAPASVDDWTVKSGDATLILRPFSTIMDETYRLYQQVQG